MDTQNTSFPNPQTEFQLPKAAKTDVVSIPQDEVPAESAMLAESAGHPSYIRQPDSSLLDEVRRKGRKPLLENSFPRAAITDSKISRPQTASASQPCLQDQNVAPIELAATTRVWGVDFAVVTMLDTVRLLAERIEARARTHVITANLNFLMLHANDPELQAATKRAELVLCDGMPIVARSRWNQVSLPERVAGSDLIYRISEQAARLGHRIYLLGAAEGVAEKAASELTKRFPGLEIVGTQCPPFRPLSQQEQIEQLQQIQSAKPDILLVAFGQPKGELWIDRFQDDLGVPVCIQLGASFDFVAGTAKRAPKFWQRIGLEWLYRACSDPRRLIPRYAFNAAFLFRKLQADLIAYLQR